LNLLTEKNDGRIKARHCANGSSQRQYMLTEDVSSPTISAEATLLISAIDAEENRHVATLDIPNAFIQTEMEDREEKVIMKIRGKLVEILCDIDTKYEDFVVKENEKKVINVHIKKAIYGLLESAFLLFYRKLSSDLIEYGFEINPYEPCVANKNVGGSQLTVTWHVDDVKLSHINNDEIERCIQWFKDRYGKIGEVKVNRGKIHKYLGMVLDFTQEGVVIVDVSQHISNIESTFPEDLLGLTVKSPWNDDLFKVDPTSKKLDSERASIFHTITYQGLFMAQRGRPDVSPAIAFCTTGVHESTEEDWSKLRRMMIFLINTKDDKLVIKNDGDRKVSWFVDASFAVHPDYKSQSGMMMTMGQGALKSSSTKQKINTRSSTEAELVAVDDMISSIVWTKNFLIAQGYDLKDNILFQDNTSAMKLEKMEGRVLQRGRDISIFAYFLLQIKLKKEM